MFTRSLTTGVVLATFVALASSAGAAVAKAAPEPATAGNPGASQVIPTSDGNRGANVPFTEYAAVKAQGNGTAIGPSYNLYTLPAEAVGRTAVTLNGPASMSSSRWRGRLTRSTCGTRSLTRPPAPG